MNNYSGLIINFRAPEIRWTVINIFKFQVLHAKGQLEFRIRLVWVTGTGIFRCNKPNLTSEQIELDPRDISDTVARANADATVRLSIVCTAPFFPGCLIESKANLAYCLGSLNCHHSYRRVLPVNFSRDCCPLIFLSMTGSRVSLFFGDRKNGERFSRWNPWFGASKIGFL